MAKINKNKSEIKKNVPDRSIFLQKCGRETCFFTRLILRVYSRQTVLIVSIKFIFSWWCITWLESNLFRNCKLWNFLKTDQFTHTDFFHRKLNCWRCMHVEFVRRPGQLDSVHMIFLDVEKQCEYGPVFHPTFSFFSRGVNHVETSWQPWTTLVTLFDQCTHWGAIILSQFCIQ